MRSSHRNPVADRPVVTLLIIVATAAACAVFYRYLRPTSSVRTTLPGGQRSRTSWTRGLM